MERSRGTLPVLFAVVVIDLVGFGIVLPVLPFLSKEFGADGLVLGLLLTSHAAMQFYFSPKWGRLSDRVGRRPVILWTIVGTSVALLLLGLADSLALLFVARLLSGLFGANIGVASAYISDVTAEEERTRWMGMLGASFGVGFVLGPAIGGGLSAFGYSVPMLFAAAMAAVNAVVAFFVLKEPERQREDAPHEAATGPSRMSVLDDPLVRRLCGANLAFSLAVTQLETVFAFFMLGRFGYDAMEVAGILVLMAVVMGGIQGGGMKRLAGRFGERSLIVGGSVLMIVSFATVPLMGTVALLLVPLLGAAVGRAVSQPSLMSLVSVAAGPDDRGAVMGTFQSAASLARVAGPVAAGALYDWKDGSPFFLAAALMLVTLFLARGLPAGGPGAKPVSGAVLPG